MIAPTLSSRIGTYSVDPRPFAVAVGRHLIGWEQSFGDRHRWPVCIGGRKTHTDFESGRAEDTTECFDGGGASTRFIRGHCGLTGARSVCESLLGEARFAARRADQMS